MNFPAHGTPALSSGSRGGQPKQSYATQQQQEFSFFAHFNPLSGQQKQVAHQILPHLFLGSAAAARSASWLRQHDITHILCVHNTPVSPSELKQQLWEHIRARRRLHAANAQASAAAAAAGMQAQAGAALTSAGGAGAAVATHARVSRVCTATSASVAAQLVLFGERCVYCCCFAQDTPQHLLLPVLPHAIAFLDNALRDSSYRGGSNRSSTAGGGGEAAAETDGRTEGMGRNHCFVSAEEAVNMYSDDCSSADVDAAATSAEAAPQQQRQQSGDGATTFCSSDTATASSETAALINGAAGGSSSSSSDGRERLLLLQSRKRTKRPTIQRGNVLVHCAKGISRSPSFVICYLMYRRCWSYNDSFVFVRRKRPVYPNVGFQIQLQHLQRKFERMRPSLPNAAAEQDGEEAQQQKKKRITAAGLLLGSCCGDDGADEDEPDLFRRDPSAPGKLLTIVRESATSLDEGQLQNRICAAIVTQLLQLQELVEKMYAQSMLLRDRQKWQCFGLFFENLKSYAVPASSDVLQIAQQVAAKAQELKLVFTATLPGVVMADVVAEEIKRWVRVVKEKERDRLIKQEEELLRRERDAAFTLQEEERKKREDKGGGGREEEKVAIEGRHIEGGDRQSAYVAGGGTNEGTCAREEKLEKQRKSEDAKEKREQNHRDAAQGAAAAAAVAAPQMKLGDDATGEKMTFRTRSGSTSRCGDSGRRKTGSSEQGSSSSKGSSTGDNSGAVATAVVCSVAAGDPEVVENSSGAAAERESLRLTDTATSDAARCAARCSSFSAAAVSATGAGVARSSEAPCETSRSRISTSRTTEEETIKKGSGVGPAPPAGTLHAKRESGSSKEVAMPATTRVQHASPQRQREGSPGKDASRIRIAPVQQKPQKPAEMPSPSSLLEGILDEETRRRLERLKKKWLKKQLKKEKKMKKKLKKQQQARKKEKRKLEKLTRAAGCRHGSSCSRGSEDAGAVFICDHAVANTAADAAAVETKHLLRQRGSATESSEETGSISSSSSSRERFSTKSRSSVSSSRSRRRCSRSISRDSETGSSRAGAHRRRRSSSGSCSRRTTPKSVVSTTRKKLVSSHQVHTHSSNQIKSRGTAEGCNNRLDVCSNTSTSPVSSREAGYTSTDARSKFGSPCRREACRSSSEVAYRRNSRSNTRAACSSNSSSKTGTHHFAECRDSVLDESDSRRDFSRSRFGIYSRSRGSCSIGRSRGYGSKKTKAWHGGADTCSSTLDDSSGRDDASCGSSANRRRALWDGDSSTSDANCSGSGDAYSSISTLQRYREESLSRKEEKGTELRHGPALMCERTKNDFEGERERGTEAYVAYGRRGGGARGEAKGARSFHAFESEEEELSRQRDRNSSSRIQTTRERDEERSSSSREPHSERCRGSMEGRLGETVRSDAAVAAGEGSSTPGRRRFKQESPERRRDLPLRPSSISERKRRLQRPEEMER